MLKSIGFEVEIPLVVTVDNVGAIYMTENVTATSKTKHVEIRYHFVREFVQDGFLKIVFANMKENDADIFTKNVRGDILEDHWKKLLENRPSDKGRVLEDVKSDWQMVVKKKFLTRATLVHTST